ncbi:MAG: mechanosensitive ion channel family protein [Chitinophagaceae bacterium]
MNEFLNFQILDNSVKAILIAIGVMLFAFFIRRLVSQVIANFIIRFSPKDEKRTHSIDFKQYISIPLGDLIFILIAFAALDKLNAPSFFAVKIYKKITIDRMLESLSQIVVIYCAFRLFTGISKFLFALWRNKAEKSKNKSAMQLIGVVGGIVNALLIMFAMMTIVNIAFGVNVGGFLAGLGIFSAAVALAGKESLENLIASFVIFLDNPFYIGDYVSVGSDEGTIESIGLRSSRLRSPDQVVIVVPNKKMVDSVVTNFSLRTKWRYIETLEVTLSATSEQLRSLQSAIADILKSEEKVDSQFVYLKETGKSAHLIYIELSIVVGPAMQDVYDVYSHINEQINDLFKKRNIAFAQESSTVSIVTEKSESQEDHKSEAEQK